MSILELELRRRNVGRIIAAVVLMGAIVAVYLSPARAWVTMEKLQELLAHLRSIWYGPIVFMLVYALACVVALPASPFVAASGIIWGWFLGASYSLAGSMIGATGAYFVARYIGGGMLAKLGARGQKIERELERAGFRPMLILRLVGIPFPVLNFAGGVARMRFGSFFLGTLLGILPSQFVIAYSGDAIAGGSLTKQEAILRVMLAAGLMALLVLIPLWLKKRYYPAGEPSEASPPAPDSGV